VLKACCDADLEKLKFFGWTDASFDAPKPFTATISRTGYTGDLGYEIWVDPEHALPLWDLLMARGKDHGIWPIGLDTLDITRIEAGFILQGCDYHSAFDTAHPPSTSSPFEVNLGWTVELDRDPFIGQRALIEEHRKGSRWAFVGLVIDWEALEAAFARHDLPPAIPTAAWRHRVPLYRGMRQVGYASSGAWSPTLKKNLALASVFSEVNSPGSELELA
jgi:aminomethyltransferase